MEGGNGCDVGTWKSNHKGPNVDANTWLVCDLGKAVGYASLEESTRHLSCQQADQKRLYSNGCFARKNSEDIATTVIETISR